MFEVKNKESITKVDIDKFIEDGKKYDISVFVSMKTKFIPGHDMFDIVIDDGKTYVYLGSDFYNIQSLTLIKLLF